jgi:hypothetical protein
MYLQVRVRVTHFVVGGPDYVQDRVKAGEGTDSTRVLFLST